MSASQTSPKDSGIVEIAHCQICGSGDRRTKLVDGPFTVCQCAACDFVYVTPRLHGEALAKVYGEGYWKSDNPKARGYADYAREASLYLKTFKKRMALVKRWAAPSARVLDIGCAAGYFLQVMRAEGHPVLGIEPSEAIAQVARRELGDGIVFVGNLDDAPESLGYREGSFDLVTMWDVIEHIPDPQAALRRARKLLAKGEAPDAVLEALSRGLTQKMLHGALAELHSASPEQREQTMQTVQRLFLRKER